MNFLSKNKGIIIAIVLIVLVFLGYAIVKPASDTGTTGLEMNVINPNPSNGLATSEDPSSQLVFQLLSIQSIVFDTKFFQDPVYRELVDQSRPLGEIDVGRPNPFLKIGIDELGSAFTTNPTISTNGVTGATTFSDTQFTKTSTSSNQTSVSTTSIPSLPRATTTNSRR